MIKNKKIFVGICLYKNDELRIFESAIRSILEQTIIDNIFVAIYADGKIKDEIKIYLNELIKRESINHCFYGEKNLGLSVGLNYLITLFLSHDFKYFVRMDADDISIKNRIELQCDMLDQHPEVDVLGSDIIEFFEDNTENIISYPQQNEDILNRFKLMAPIAHVTAVMRRRFFNHNLRYDEHVGKDEDLKLWLDAFKLNRIFACINKPLVKVRVSTDFLKRRKKYSDLYKTFQLKTKIIKELDFEKKYYIINIIYFLIKLLPGKLLKIIYKLR